VWQKFFPDGPEYGQPENDQKTGQSENLPASGFPAPPLLDHTQYKTLTLKHQAADKQFEYSGTNAFTAKIKVVAPSH
jgi:hypothetical protein